LRREKTGSAAANFTEPSENFQIFGTNVYKKGTERGKWVVVCICVYCILFRKEFEERSLISRSNL
jgi:hypothetical protein